MDVNTTNIRVDELLAEMQSSEEVADAINSLLDYICLNHIGSPPLITANDFDNKTSQLAFCFEL